MARILSIGEVLWDLFPDYKKPGGSPANIAYHAHCLGHESLLLSRVGSDAEGEELIRFLKEKGLSTRYIQQCPYLPTGRVTIEFRKGEPSYTIHEPSAWDAIELTENLKNELPRIDAVCFASLAQRNRKTAATVNELLSLAPASCLKVFDLNLRPPFSDRTVVSRSMELADVIKMNEEELQAVSGWFGNVDPHSARKGELHDSGKEEKLSGDRTDDHNDNSTEEQLGWIHNDFVKQLLSRWPEKTILVTLGSRGSIVYTRDATFSQNAFPVKEGGDFVGVGDAFLACFTHLMLNHTPMEEILEQANRYAAIVASQQGGMPDIPADTVRQIEDKCRS